MSTTDSVGHPKAAGASHGLRPFLSRLAAGARSALDQPREWGKITEVGLIVLWGFWLGVPYLDYLETQWPIGGEFGFQVQSHHLWNWLRECGLCALWNGGINGGYPALAETYGAPLHPLVAVTTLGWGPVIGAKLTVVCSFCLAGIAQWWIARAMGLRWPARLWAGLAAVVGGHLSGRMDLGGISLVLSTASASLALAAMADLGLSLRRKAAVLLGVAVALTLVSGQGYMQVALLCWAPLILVFAVGDRARLRTLMKECLVAISLAAFVAGVFLVPFLHFWPNVHKASDPLFQAAQSLEYIPLNLVIRDIKFMMSAALGKMGVPHLYNIYVGWVPVLLVGLALLLRRKADWRVLAFLAAGPVTLFAVSSALPLRWLLPYAPWLAIIRHTPLISGLAVPGILALAAYGLDAAFRLRLPSLQISSRARSARPGFALSGAWLLAVPLASGLRISFDHSREWLGEIDRAWAYQMSSEWRTPSLEWVQPPYGAHFWLESALEAGLKVSAAWYPWVWEGREAPLPRIEAVQGQTPANATYLGTERGVRTYLHEERHYAFVTDGGAVVPCAASGGAGDIVVRCADGEGGVLHVDENAWEGWWAWVDGAPVDLFPGDRLSVRALPGEHLYRFRYLPWDVPVGLLLTLAGGSVAIALYVRADRRKA
jgi:hypothetical protein